VPMSPSERKAQLRWRAVFGLFAAREEGAPVNAELGGDEVYLRQDETVHRLELETFIAYLTNRPQQLRDAKQRTLVRRLGATG
jgi:hypothetical protein